MERAPRLQLNADPDYFETAIRGRDDAVRPHVLLLERAGEPRALAVGRVEEITLPCKLGYRTVYAPRVRALTVVYDGLLGDPSDEDTEIVFEELGAALARGEADVLRLRNLEVDSPLHRLATRTPSVLTRQHTSTTSVHWELTLPDSLDELLQSKSSSFRKDARYDERRLAKEFGDPPRSRSTATAPTSIGCLASSRTSARRRTSAALGSPSATGARPRVDQLAAERGCSVPTCSDRRRAARVRGRRSRIRALRPGHAGLRPRPWSPGIGTSPDAPARRCLRGPSVEVFDFGFGDAFYKALGDPKKLEEDVLVFASSPRGVRVNLTRTAVLKAAPSRAPLPNGHRRCRV